jgi:hypothetical protein
MSSSKSRRLEPVLKSAVIHNLFSAKVNRKTYYQLKQFNAIEKNFIIEQFWVYNSFKKLMMS